MALIPKHGDAPPGLEGVPPEYINMLTSATGGSGRPLSADDPCGVNEIEFWIDGSAERLWAQYRPALIRESRRRGVGQSWAERVLEKAVRRSEERGEA
jgi:hypothetical protein